MKKQYFYSIIALGVVFVSAVAVSYVGAWTTPGQAPTGGNVAAPLNTGSSAQTKSGDLRLGSGKAFMGAGSLYYYGDSTNLAARVADTGAFYVQKASDGSVRPIVAQDLAFVAKDASVKWVSDLDQTVTNLSAGSGVPAGAIMAFYLSACPSGWAAANGANGTIDLRGYFIRGLDTRTTNAVDPGAPRILGSVQTYAIQSHAHSVTDPGHKHNMDADKNPTFNNDNDFFAVGSKSGTDNGSNDTDTDRGYTGISINAAGGAETRPINKALLYCQKL